MEPLSPTPLVVFGLDHVDTSRAETLVQCLTNKIKEKRCKLDKMMVINDEKRKRNQCVESDKLQLTTKLTNIEHEISIFEQKLQSEQVRIKELQLNIQLLRDHNNSMKRDCANEERKYEEEKLSLINKFEYVKQQWTQIFKPQYEQSKVYKCLKQGDLTYNMLAEQKETLVKTQKLAYREYFKRREEYCNGKDLHSAVLLMAKCFVSRHAQFIKVEHMKKTLSELENKQKQLLDSKIQKMKAWESVYTQATKRDLTDFCLRRHFDQELTLPLNSTQPDSGSQPASPMVLTPANERIELVPDENVNVSVIGEIEHAAVASIITIIPNTTNKTPTKLNRPSILHLTTAIDDDDELFSRSRRKVPTSQVEPMNVNDESQSTQGFAVSTSSNVEMQEIISNVSESYEPTTQAFATTPMFAHAEATSVWDSMTAMEHVRAPQPITIPPVDHNSSVSHTTAALQNQVTMPTTSPIRSQVTSHDVQQMLLTFSADSSSNNENQPQSMEYDSEEPPTPLNLASMGSAECTQGGYAGFNYNFRFDDATTSHAEMGGADFMSTINFGDWPNLTEPLQTDSSDQYPMFLQQTNTDVDTSFSFATFNFAGAGETTTTTDTPFGSFFFGNNDNTINGNQLNNKSKS